MDYISRKPLKPVSNVHNLPSTGPDSGPALQQTPNDAILAYLRKTDDTTKALGEQVQAIERKQIT